MNEENERMAVSEELKELNNSMDKFFGELSTKVELDYKVGDNVIDEQSRVTRVVAIRTEVVKTYCDQTHATFDYEFDEIKKA